MTQSPDAPDDRGVGLCARCRHAQQQRNARGNVFWRCLAAERNDALLRYPPLPVHSCHAFGPGPPTSG